MLNPEPSLPSPFNTLRDIAHSRGRVKMGKIKL